MTMLALLLAATAPANAVEAERAFAAMAQSDGQWAAFRAFAAPDAIMFVPEATNARAWLKDRPEPPVPVMWWPGTTFASCDDSLAANTGPWIIAPNGAVGKFSTIWKRQPDGGWQWLLDHGRTTPLFDPSGASVAEISPNCDGTAADRERRFSANALNLAADAVVQRENAMPERPAKALPAVVRGEPIAGGHSADWTLAWESRRIDGPAGAHDLAVWQWRGTDGWKLVLYETVGLAAQ